MTFRQSKRPYRDEFVSTEVIGQRPSGKARPYRDEFVATEVIGQCFEAGLNVSSDSEFRGRRV